MPCALEKIINAGVSGNMLSRISYENGIPRLWCYYRICRNIDVIWAVFTTTMPMATKLGSMVTYLDWLIPIKSHDTLIACSCKIPSQIKYYYISINTVLMTTKLGKMVDHL